MNGDERNKKEYRVASMIAKRIKNDIADRSGIGNEWEAIDDALQSEILDTWRKIILEELAKV